MKKLKKPFKIVVLEDNEFYNSMLTRQIKGHTDEMHDELGYDFEIDSYTSSTDCMRNLKADTDIAILDYYLGESKNAMDILKVIKDKCKDCKIIIISQFKNLKTYYQTLNEGAYHFIFKDRSALEKSCTVIDDIVNERLNPSL
jgi:DNA-binding NtrC family response regulator